VVSVRQKPTHTVRKLCVIGKNNVRIVHTVAPCWQCSDTVG